MNSDLISVVIPFCKADYYLEKCVLSILIQTYPNFELMLLNKGSPYKSGLIYDDYTIIDTKVRVFHQENGELSHARNIGIEISNGELITFKDSDDWVTEDYLETLLNMIQENDV